MSIRIGIGLDVFGAGIDADATTIYNRIMADGGVSNLSRLNFFVKGLKAIYGDLANVPVCYDAHWIGYKLGSGTGATAGQAAAKLYSLTVAGDAVQSTAASQPLLLAHNGVNYWWGSGAVSNYCSTPNAAANQITGSFDIAVYASALDWGQSFGMLQTKFTTGANGNYYFCTASTKKLIYGWSDGTARSVTTTVNTPFANGTSGWLKASHNTTTGTISIYYSNDAVTTAYNSISWTLLESLTGVSGARNNFNCPIEIGSNATGQNTLLGKIYRATLSNSIDGTPVVDFNPATYNAAVSQTSWTSSTGEVWTISTASADTGLAGKLVDRTVIMGNGTTFSMAAVSPSFTRKQLTWLVAANQSNATNASFIKINKSTDTNSGIIRVLTATTMQNTTSDAFSLLGGSTVDGVSTVTIVRNKLHVLKGLNSLMDGGTVARIDIFDDNPNVRFIRGVLNTVVHTSNTNDISALLRTLNNL